jgi:signal transduction histidine kinase
MDLQDDVDAIGRIDAVPTILEVVCRITGMGFAAVARVTEDRWIACSVLDNIQFGLKPGGELEVKSTICNEIRQVRTGVVIDHVAEDAVWCKHHTPARYGFQSYISMPIIRRDGSFFGTLCAIDPRPMPLNKAETIGMFKLFAELIATHLDAGEQLKEAQGALAKERSLADLREQFITVLGHDLRNPLAAVDSGITLLQRTPLDDRARDITAHMKASVVRMRGIIDNVLNLARARLGQPITARVEAARPLEPTLETVVSELRLIRPNRTIVVEVDLREPVVADHSLLAQLFSNLLSNALTHGADDAPVKVTATSGGGTFELAVSNAGAAIPETTMGRIFRPFFRGTVDTKGEGLGLGLHIASEIARAHGGTLTANSVPGETRFVLRMPSRPKALAET